MSRRKTIVVTGVLLAAVLLGLVFFSSNRGEEDPETALPDGIELIEPETETEQERAADTLPDGVDKSETVDVKADASGAVQEIKVSEVLRRQSGTTEIVDDSQLSEIRNTKGDETFIQQPDGTIIWENKGEEIEYEGMSNLPLPVSVQIHYYLNGQEIQPQQLAGQSGKLKIRFDYTNETQRRITVDGKKIKVKVPFTVISAMVLSSDVFSNIKVENAKLMTMGDQSMIVGCAFPGLADSLKLDRYEPTKETEIPDFIEVTADVRDFELDFTTTIVSAGLFEDIDLFDDAEDLTDSMKELNRASGKLVDGAEELVKGIQKIRSSLQQYVDGVTAIDNGARQLKSGLTTLSVNGKKLESGAQALQNGLEQLDASLSKISLDSSDETQLAEAIQAARALGDDVLALSESLEQLNMGLIAVQEFSEQAQSYAAAVEAAEQTIRQELEEIQLSDLAEAANATARTQAGNAVDAALDGTQLTEEEKLAIRNSVVDSIDVSAAIDGRVFAAQEHIGVALDSLQNVPELTLPETSSIDIVPMVEAVSDMQSQLTILSRAASGLSDQAESLSSLPDMLDTLKQSVSKLADGSAQLTDGIEAFGSGIDQLGEGASTLSSGTGKLNSAGSALNSGMQTLEQGAKSYEEGIKVFDEDGIGQLNKLAGNDLKKIIQRMRAVQKADSQYENYAGISEGKNGSVRFIIETEEIKE